MEEKQINHCCIDYDVIFVGQLGAVVSNILLNHCPDGHKFLVINDSKQVFQPSLLPFQNPVIKIKKTHPKNCDIQTEKIYRIYPESNAIAMENRKFYRYKYLVYTAGLVDWSDFSYIQNLSQALKTHYSFVYSNIIKTSPEFSHPKIIFQQFQKGKKLQIKRISNLQSNQRNQNKNKNHHDNLCTEKFLCHDYAINIIFYVPKPPHNGYDNLNILHKMDQFLEYYRKNIQELNDKVKQYKISNMNSYNKKTQKSEDNLNFILLLEGQSLFPSCLGIDTYLKQKIKQKGVKILKNHQIQKIDYLRRKIIINCIQQDSVDHDQNDQVSIKIKNKISLKFNYLYIVIKQKIPSLLQEAGINPYENCQKYLMNQRFKNIFIYGADLFPTSQSFTAMNYQAHIISTNIFRLLDMSRKSDNIVEFRLKEYNGYTQFCFWLSKSSFIKLQHEYSITRNLKKQNKQKIIRNQQNKFKIKQNNYCFSLIDVLRYEFIYKIQSQLFYNLRSHGAPYYFFVPVQEGLKRKQ